MQILALSWDIVRTRLIMARSRLVWPSKEPGISTFLHIWIQNLGPSIVTEVWRWDLFLSLFGEERGWVCSSWRHMTTLFRCDTAEQKGDLSAPESFVVRMLCWLSSTYDTRIKRAVVTPGDERGYSMEAIYRGYDSVDRSGVQQKRSQKKIFPSLSVIGDLLRQSPFWFSIFILFLETLWNVALGAAMKFQLNLRGLLDYRLWCWVRACLTSCYYICFFTFCW